MKVLISLALACVLLASGTSKAQADATLSVGTQACVSPVTVHQLDTSTAFMLDTDGVSVADRNELLRTAVRLWAGRDDGVDRTLSGLLAEIDRLPFTRESDRYLRKETAPREVDGIEMWVLAEVDRGEHAVTVYVQR